MTTDPSQTAADFQTTHWGMVYGARGDRTGLEHLLRRYWPPVYAFIRRQGYGGHDASDLTQEFLAQVVIGRDIVGRADPSRGRFRAFLKQALRNFLIDQQRLRRQGKGHGALQRESSSNSAGPVEDRSDPADPGRESELSRLFDKEWAATIVQLTLSRLEDASRREGLTPHWEAFRTNVLGPALWRTQAMEMAALARRVGAADADQASNMVQTMKRKFRRTLREVVGETVASSDQVDEELAALRDYFGS